MLIPRAMQPKLEELAGRTALLALYPLSQGELVEAGLLPARLDEWLLMGGYPRIYRSAIAPADHYPAYIQTYLERDVRAQANIGSLDAFQRFMRLCAGRIGCILDMTELSGEEGIDGRTAKRWLSVLQASSVVELVGSFAKSFNKRLVKRPKLWLCDTGFAASLYEIPKVDIMQLLK